MTTEPSIPLGWRVESHKEPRGLWLAEKTVLKLYGRQKDGFSEYGHDIRKRVKNPLNAVALDYLLSRPNKIPKSWEGKLVFFWGTIYRVPPPQQVSDSATVISGQLYVRCILKSGGQWIADSLSLDDDFGPSRVSAEVYLPNPIVKFIKKAIEKVFLRVIEPDI